MRLFEHQAKQLLAEAGLSVPRGAVTGRAEEAGRLAASYGRPVMIKAQVRSGGRGKAGGILAADNPEEAEAQAARLLGSDLKGERVAAVLVEERADLVQELYAAVLTDRGASCPLLLLGASGGVEIEATAQIQPASVARAWVDPALGLADFQLRYLVNRAGLAPELRQTVMEVLRRIEQIYRSFDAMLVEVNPLGLLADGRLVALDARLEIDDNALFRQPRIAELRALTPTEERVEAAGFHYLPLEGQIGLISTGSGACMALMDLLSTQGLRPANFMELGQSMGTGGTQVATEILLERPEVRAILVAGYSGGPLERLAGGVLEVLARHPERQLPVVVSLQGRNDAEAMRLAAESGDPRVKTAVGYRNAVETVASLLP
jgi:succinyl-CoA synthetase beta subunit